MSVRQITIFDAESVSNISQIICVAPDTCFQAQAYNLAPGETVVFESVQIEVGQFGTGGNSCCEIPPNQAPQQVGSAPYSPCGQQLSLSDTRNMVVVRTPGCYRLVLTPSALGTAVVTATLMDDNDACEAAASACCCEPEVPWLGSSVNPFLIITPGGPLGHSPVFNYELCGQLNALTSNPNPVLTDEVLFMSGGACFRTTIDNLFSDVVLCDSLNEQPLLPPAAGDQVVGLDAGANCKRMDGETFVEFFETPWTGISITPALVIAPGGVNGHGPTFSYDLCADIQAQASCACEPNPGDQILIVQGGACVLATWPTVDVCDQLGLLPNGALIVGDTVLVREAGGACKQVLATAFATPSFPILAPNGSCLAPTYSFTTDPTSGMFYNIVNASVIVSDANCTDFIEIGNSVDINAATSFVRLRGGYTGPGAACGLIVETNAIERLRIGSNGAWNLNTLGGGVIGQAIVTSGPGAPPQWSYPTGIANGLFSLQIAPTGEWIIDGAGGVAGQAPVSNGPGVPPTWQTPSGVAEPNTQIVYGTGAGVDSQPDLLSDVTNGRFHVNVSAGGSPSAFAVTPAGVRIDGGRNTNAVAGNGGLVQIYGGNMTTALIGTGGQLDFRGGNGGDGGGVELFGGNASGQDRPPGLVNIRGGNNTNAVPDAGNRGGGVTINGGSGGAGGRGGNILIQGGNDGAGVSPATNNVSIGFDGVDGNGTAISLFANPATVSRWTGGTGVPTVTKGQDIQIEAGSGDGGTLTSDSGDLFLGTGIRGGHPAGTGEYGHVVIYGATTPIGRPLADFNATTGDVCLAGSGGPAPGAANTTLPAATTGGFTWLPRIAADPIGIPNGVNFVGGAFGGYANPVTIEQEGGQTCLWVYNFAAAAWHSTCFNAGGAIATPAFPLLGADGSCAAPTYSFTSSPDSGMFYDPAGLGKVVIGDDNCFDKIEIGASINIIVGGGHAVGTGGGAVTIQAARSITAAAGGNVNINAGKADGAGAGGFLLFEAGRGGGTGPGGSIQLECGLSGVTDGGDYTVITGSSPGRGGRFSVNMGAGNTGVSSTNAEAGFVWPGAPASTNFGSFGLYTGGIIAGGRIFTMDNSGDMTFHGSVGSAGTKHIYSTRDITLGRTDLVAASASGFPWIPTVPAAPTGVPVAFGGCVPMVAQETGGTIVLWMYEFGTATWRNVVLA